MRHTCEMPRRRQEGEDEEEVEDRGWTEGKTRHVPAEPVDPAPPGHPELTSPRGAPSGAASPVLQPGPSTSGKRSNPPGGSTAGPGAGKAKPRGGPSPALTSPALPSPALQGPQAPQPPAGLQTQHLPCGDSLTSPGLPRLRSGGCSSGALLSRGLYF